MSNGICRTYNGHECQDLVCGRNDGDCDPGQCPSGFICGKNNFLDLHPLLTHCTKNIGIIHAEACIEGIPLKLVRQNVLVNF